MKLKIVELDGQTYAEVQDGKPVFVGDDGKDIAFDAPGTVATISRLNGEAKGHREAKEAAEAKLKGFEGIEDPEAARTALSTVKNLNDKKLIDAGEADKVKQEAIKATEAKFAPVLEEVKGLKEALHTEKIGGAFNRSKFIADKSAIPADLVESRFGKHFAIEDGRVVASDASGNKLYSRAQPGELAGFDEALELLIDAYPYKDQILKGAVKEGGGSQGQGAGAGAGGKTMSRKEFDGLSPDARMTRIREGTTLVD